MCVFNSLPITALKPLQSVITTSNVWFISSEVEQIILEPVWENDKMLYYLKNQNHTVITSVTKKYSVL